MPAFNIETSYRLPVFRHRSYLADTPEAAYRLAIGDDDWSAERLGYEPAGETHITGIWQGADAACRGAAIPVPGHFKETVQRQAAHFERLPGLPKIMVGDAQAGRVTAAEWMGKAAWPISVGEAILANAPHEPTETGGPT
ncbi:hypothetical protein FJ930_13095 [Mesorhizobium sp. B2-4-15]|uniref:hypothetical protein n=1 Tax=unclassified Mesorhizobium TaxID=325217 RepID=UPI00112A43BA|nr:MULTISPECIES: hypothetical protein [unclassified Mesorhizobium]TPK72099.1 hypothetical protein FJ930_13095 [Mesorhizobium sp. B2-4-15]TPM26940.1 hypothetical protein FJ958_19050 [Mesorhizobium sp. B2-3-5]